jgi:WD40 repeat protein
MSAPSDLVAKRRKMDGTAKPSSSSAATATASASAAAGDRANVIAQLEDADGNPAGPQLDLPHDADHTQLETLLNALLQNEDKVPFAFYAADAEVIGPLGAHLAKRGASTETVLKIVYQPQALFRVRPVTRCSSAIPGHAEAVLSVAFSPDGKNLASGSGDTTIRLWNHDTETPKATLKGAFYLTLVPIRPRWRGERRSLRTLPGVSLRPPLGFNPRPRCLSTPLLTPLNSTHRSFQLGSLHRVVAGRAAARVRVDGQGRAVLGPNDG